jgi:hypothetical protein
MGKIFINNVDLIFFLETPEENSRNKTLPWTRTFILSVIASFIIPLASYVS